MPTSLPTSVDARAIVLLQDRCTALWHETVSAGMNPELRGVSFLRGVEDLHRANFALWHAEDEARQARAGDSLVASVKRLIDSVNQERNDAVERMDAWLLASLQEQSMAGQSPRQQGEQHSETPGMMIDRLSILSLKLFHTQEEIDRVPAPAGHRERNTKRFDTLRHQRDDLAQCLDRLWAQVCAGERHFKQYQQLKMYNDPELNPVLYRAMTKDTET